MASMGSRLKHAWNAFTTSRDPLNMGGNGSYSSFGGRPDRNRPRISNERSILASILTRLSIDFASVDIRHVRTDDQGRYLDDMVSGFNECLTVAANIDQEARAFRQDIAMTLFDEGVCAIVPIDTTLNPLVGSYDINTMRVGKVVMWYPEKVEVRVYNQKTGIQENVTLPKKMVAIVENPLYQVMNEPNSTLQRLMRKLSLLDSTDEKSASGKLDLIIQLPYVIKSEARRQQAEQRRKDIEFQLSGSQYGIAYTDGTEKITQLNRAVENNLQSQVEYLTDLLYTQLGLTPAVMNGTADETTMNSYYDRTIEPILDSVVEAMRHKFLTKTARTQLQSVMYFRNLFKLIPIGGEGGIADIADKFTRNEIASSNEIRQVVGWKPSKEPKADQLINSNMPQSDTGVAPPGEEDPELDSLEAEMDATMRQYGVAA